MRRWLAFLSLALSGFFATGLAFGMNSPELEGLSVTSSTALAAQFYRGSDWGGGVGGLLYSVRGTTPSYKHYDARGDVVDESNSTSAATWNGAYEAFGLFTQQGTASADRQRANTKEEDPTGLLNEGMRYRDLDAGVFITRDPAGFVDGPNVYCYVVQNPWTKFDPEGLATIGDYERDEMTAQTDYQNQVRDVNSERRSEKINQDEANKKVGDLQDQRDKRIADDKAHIGTIVESAKWVNEKTGLKVYNASNLRQLDDGDGGPLGGTLEARLGVGTMTPGQQEYADIRWAMTSGAAFKDATIAAVTGGALKIGGKVLGALGSRLAPMLRGAGKVGSALEGEITGGAQGAVRSGVRAGEEAFYARFGGPDGLVPVVDSAGKVLRHIKAGDIPMGAIINSYGFDAASMEVQGGALGELFGGGH